MNRRTFLQLLAAAAAGPALSGQGAESKPGSDRLGTVLPKRTFGASGEQVTCIGLGGFHVGWTTDRLAQETIEAALEEGVRFFDTAESYGPETSEIRFGKWLVPQARDLVFLMTKSGAKTADDARAHLEGSLRRMRTDTVDLWQIHALQSPGDAEERVAAGVLDFALKARDEGKIRHIGFTGHASPYALRRMLELGSGAGTFSACQFPVNPVDAASAHSFLSEFLPAAAAAGLAPVAMKTLADGRFFGEKLRGDRQVWSTDDPIVPVQLSVDDCTGFALSMPVSTVVVGAEKPEFLRDKTAAARRFAGMDSESRQHLVDRVARFAEAGQVEYYKAADLRG